MTPSQHFTEPPPRFSEASLVKALEEYGIGRPSTYASIISTLRDRQYVDIESRRFTATDIGKIVSRFLTQYFTTYVDYDFTAKMEDSLDAVATGEKEWVPLLDRFWKPFIKLVEHTEKSVSREEVAQARDLGHRPGERQADERAHGPLRPVRADRHQGRRGEAALRGPAPRPEDGHHHARGGAGAVPAAAQARHHRRRARKSSPTPAASDRTSSMAPKYVSLKTDDPYTITLERALEVIREKQIADANRLILDFPDAGIQVLNGRYGPYITDKTRNAKIPKDRDPKSLTLRGVPGHAGRRAGAHVRQVGPQEQGGREAAAAKSGGAKRGAAASRRAAAKPARARAAKRAGRQPAPQRRLGREGSARLPAHEGAPGAEGRPQRLAAKGSKAAAKKRAPAEPQATSKPARQGRAPQELERLKPCPSPPERHRLRPLRTPGRCMRYLGELHDRITAAVEAIDGARFRRDAWQRPGGGGGESRVLSEGADVRESRRVRLARVRRQAAALGLASRPQIAGAGFEAMGLSLVFHPRNPYVPTTHCNVRFLLATPEEGAGVWWFGGGFDLTPYYPFDEDVLHWHRTARDACAPFGSGLHTPSTRRGATGISSCRTGTRRAASAACSSTIWARAASRAASTFCAASATIFCRRTCRSSSGAGTSPGASASAASSCTGAAAMSNSICSTTAARCSACSRAGAPNPS